MEAGAVISLQSWPALGSEKPGRRKAGFLQALQGGYLEERRATQTLRVGDPRRSWASVRSGSLEPKISCCSRGHEKIHNPVDEALMLKRKSEEVQTNLNERCIFLVGMMGSGKSTVGKIIAEVLGYSFFDSDKLVEQAVGMPSVAQIFKVHSEAFFRDNESKVLRDLSTMRRLVVATGGGAVIRPINWRYMKQGISVWLDVPLDALARRIAAVGTASRPLLDEEAGDPYTKAFAKLTALAEQRGDAYANADARVILEDLSAKQGHSDVSALTPTDIAIEALLKIEGFLTEKEALRSSSQPQIMG